MGLTEVKRGIRGQTRPSEWLKLIGSRGFEMILLVCQSMVVGVV